MNIEKDTIEVRIASGPDRMGLAIGLFDNDADPDNDVRPVYFRLGDKLGEVNMISVQIDIMKRESGRQTRLWCFEGNVSARSREKTGYALAERITGFYDLNDRKGWIRFRRI